MKFCCVCIGLLFSFHFSLSQESPVMDIRINPLDAVGGKAEQIFDKVTYIPLETTKKSLFGQIDQLGVTDKYFIIRDRNTNSILIFYKNGKFHSRIEGGDVSTAKNRSTNLLSSFAIGKARNEVVFQKGFYKVMTYNIDRKKIREQKKSYETLERYIFPKDIVVYSEYNSIFSFWPDSIDYELKYTRGNKIYRKDFPYNKKSALLQSNDVCTADHSPFYEIGNDTTVFYSKPYDYHIYKLTPTGISKAYKFIFPLAISMPEDFVTNPVYNGKRCKYFENNKNLISGVWHTYLIWNNLFFKLPTYTFGANSSFIYNLKTGSLICVERITADSSTVFLPITDNGIRSVEFANSNFLTCDGKSVYTAYSSLLMFGAKEANLGRNVKYSEALEKYFTRGSKKDNPVIVQLEPKTTL